MHNTDFVFLSENTVTETERETVEFSKHIRAWKLVVLIFFFFLQCMPSRGPSAEFFLLILPTNVHNSNAYNVKVQYIPPFLLVVSQYTGIDYCDIQSMKYRHLVNLGCDNIPVLAITTI